MVGTCVALLRIKKKQNVITTTNQLFGGITMKMKKTLTAALIVGAFSLTSGLVIADDLSTRGPVPFATWDADNSGAIDEQEFNTLREQRQAAVKASGRQGKNLANASTFAQIDSNGDGQISTEELSAMQQGMGKGRQGSRKAMQQGQGNKQGKGKGQAQSSMLQGQGNKQYMGKGHYGSRQAMKGKMGPRYQAMDAETRKKHDAFFASTTELRKEMAAKRAEKQAVMRSADPDPDQAAQLTRELLALRSQMKVQAQEAGIDMASGSGRGKGHGGKGQGCRARG